MPSIQARRTLVKSPPELWAELSDAEALGRHLQSLGEIRITRLEPESTVAWEGARARGTVQIEASGWGTRVTLTAESNHAVAEVDAAEPPLDGASGNGDGQVSEPDPEPEPEPAPPPEPPALQPDALAVDEPLPQTTAALGQAYPPEPPAADARRRRFRPGRLWRDVLGRRNGHTAEPEPVPPAPEEPVPLRPIAPLPDPEPDPIPEPQPEPPPAAAAMAGAPDPEPAPSRRSDGDAALLDQVLNAVLDDLGAAHHRPFSRG